MSHLTVVILGTQSSGMPHAAALQAANPEVDIRLVMAPEDVGEARKVLWRNCDRNIRDWWIQSRDTTDAERVLFLEWDVFCNVPLRDVMPWTPADMVGAWMATAVRDGRTWPGFREAARLPRSIQHHAVGIWPSAVLLFSRACLDAIADPQWADVYERDILSEIRTATIARACGFTVGSCDQWSQVTVHPRPLPAGASGIYHPIKRI